MLQDGTLVDAPLEDEIVPEAPQRPASHRPRLCPIGFTEPRLEGRGACAVSPNTQTPTRSGDNLQAPSPQRIRTPDSVQEFLNRNRKCFRDAASSFEKTVPLDYVVAVDHATIGWSSHLDSHRNGECNLLLQREVSSDTPLQELRACNLLLQLCEFAVRPHLYKNSES